ncbi:hypothetical protein FDUTEX481_00743, partial [Tolypothrix sp. PCC 7601]
RGAGGEGETLQQRGFYVKLTPLGDNTPYASPAITNYQLPNNQ